MKAYGGADLQEIFNRLINAKRDTEKYGINAFEFYPLILNRGSNLRSLLSSIPPRQQEETQARLIFEILVATRRLRNILKWMKRMIAFLLRGTTCRKSSILYLSMSVKICPAGFRAFKVGVEVHTLLYGKSDWEYR